MSPRKELLFSCIVMMHLSFMAPQPIELRSLRENVNQVSKLSLWHLEVAEKNYVKHVGGGPPKGFSLELLEDITLLGENTTINEIQTSIGVIIDCLNKCLPEIVRRFTQQHQDVIIKNVTEFSKQFKPAVRQLRSRQNETGCVNITTLDDYHKKQVGLQIINSARRWVESLI